MCPESSQEQEEFRRKQEEEERRILQEKYKAKGVQKMSLKEYESLKERKSKKKGISIPSHFRFALTTPFLIVFCFGVFFLPFIIFSIVTGKSKTSADKKDIKKNLTYEEYLKQKEAEK